MKLILGVVGILLGFASVDAFVKPQSVECREKMHKLHEECIKTSGVDPETLKKIEEEDLKFPETNEWKVHAKCLMKGLGFIDDDGKIDPDAIRTELKKVVSEEKAKEIAQKCNVQIENSEETAYQLGKCLYLEFHPSEA